MQRRAIAGAIAAETDRDTNLVDTLRLNHARVNLNPLPHFLPFAA
jgi:hypothetical protein